MGPEGRSRFVTRIVVEPVPCGTVKRGWHLSNYVDINKLGAMRR